MNKNQRNKDKDRGNPNLPSNLFIGMTLQEELTMINVYNNLAKMTKVFNDSMVNQGLSKELSDIGTVLFMQNLIFGNGGNNK